MKTLKLLSAAACALFLAGVARAADDVKTITGEAMCAKCELHQQAKCQTVIQVQEAGKTVSYYVAPNDVAKAFHPTVCQASAEVTATGTVANENGKLVLTASSIELKK